MASSLRTSILPERVAAVLSIRSSAPACPEEVERALSSHAFFTRKVVAAPAPRFGRLPAGDEDRSGRFGGFRSAPRAAPVVSEDGFETVSGGGRRRGGGGGAFTDRRHHYPSAPYTSGGTGRMGGGGSAAAAAPTPAPAAPAEALTFTPIAEAPAPAPAFAKFSSAALRAGLDVEDRMLARVKGKINRLGHGTYEATKVFMQQILSAEETDFLDELMKYIFNKASNESAYCPLYAKLLHELGEVGKFPGLCVCQDRHEEHEGEQTFQHGGEPVVKSGAGNVVARGPGFQLVRRYSTALAIWRTLSTGVSPIAVTQWLATWRV